MADDIGLNAGLDLTRWNTGYNKYLADVRTLETRTAQAATNMTASGQKMGANVSRSLSNVGSSAATARTAIYGMTDALELTTGRSLMPTVSALAGATEGFTALGLSIGTVATALGLLAGGVGLGVAGIEGLKSIGVIPAAQNTLDVAKQLAAMAAGGAGAVKGYVTSLGDMDKAIQEGNKAFTDAATSLGVMTDQTRALIYSTQGFQPIKTTYIDLTKNAEAYAKAQAQQRDIEKKRAAIVVKYEKDQSELIQKTLEDDRKAEDDYYKARSDAMRKYNLDVQRAEEDYQRNRRIKAQSFEMSIGDAIASRDATTVLRLRRQRDFELRNADEEQNVKMQRMNQDAAAELETLTQNFVETQKVRDDAQQTELAKLTAAKAEDLRIFQKSLDDEKAAREQYAKDIADFWARQELNFPTRQAFPNFNFPIPEGPAGQAVTQQTVNQTTVNNTTNPVVNAVSVIGTEVLTAGVLPPSIKVEVQGLFERAIENVMANIFGGVQ